jgi:CPA1 family monovalent cation:H+ antiporter
LAELSGGSDRLAAPRILFPSVALAVAIVLFEGGLSLKLSELRESGGAALRLCTLSALLTISGSALAAYYCLGLPWRLSWLLGAILVVTGPTVIGPLLRQVQPSNRVANTLKWEGIVIDPIGAVLAVLVFEVLMLNPGQESFAQGALLLSKTIAVGVIGGVLVGLLAAAVLKRFLLPDRLHGVATLGSVLLLFAACDSVAHESGLIAVTILGVWMTNQSDLDIEHIIEFKENLRTLLIGCLFIVLASRIDITLLGEVGWPGLLFVAVLILVVRPLSVFASLLGSDLDYREQCFVAAMAPRGIVAAAVSSVFALRMEQSDATNLVGTEQLTLVTFLVIIGTVAVYGLCASPLARWLGLSNPSRDGALILGADDWVIGFATELERAGVKVLLIDTNYRKVTKAKLANIDAVCANIMNEHARSELPLSGIGHFLALTQNDHVNTLAVRECRSLFGRSNAYQLTFKTDSPRGMTRNMMGRELFAEDLTYSRLAELVAGGMEFKTTTVSDEFTYADFQTHYQQARPLALVGEGGVLTVITADMTVAPEAETVVIALVWPDEQEPVAEPSTHEAQRSGLFRE